MAEEHFCDRCARRFTPVDRDHMTIEVAPHTKAFMKKMKADRQKAVAILTGLTRASGVPYQPIENILVNETFTYCVDCGLAWMVAMKYAKSRILITSKLDTNEPS